MMKDPVCGMLVDTRNARFTTDHNGRTYAFCSAACRDVFQKDPAHYLKRRNIITRFLEWIARGNRDTFCDAPPSCCGQ